MAYSDEDILGKIGDLLVEINEQYAGLDKDNLEGKKSEIFLLASQAKYLAAQMEFLASKQSADSVVTSSSFNIEGVHESTVDVKEEEETFTPAVDHEEHEADQQPVEEEIQEVEDVEVFEEKEDEQPFIEEYNEREPESTVYGEESDKADEEVREEEKEELKEEPSREEPIPVHSASTAYTTLSSTQDTNQDHVKREEVEVKEKEEVKPVVNEVIIEKKQIELEEDPEPEVSLNDLAKQAEVKPSRPLTLNELIQQQKKAGLTNANQFNTSQDKSSDRVTDLKVAVSLNDKLLFIKDLFNGYSLAYSEAIELLNRFDNFAEADAFLQSNYALKNNWATKPQTVDKLYAVLRKKYI